MAPGSTPEPPGDPLDPDVPAAPVELLGVDDPSRRTAIVSEGSVTSGGLRSPLVLAGVGAVVLAVAAVVLAWPGTADPSAGPPSTTDAVPVPSTGPPPTEPPSVEERAATLAGLGVPLRAVITSTARSEAVLVEVDCHGEVVMGEVPPLAGYAFDRSGRWLAGMSYSRVGPRRPVLWVGPVDGELEPVEVGAQGFAWNDQEPGRLAWVSGQSGQVLTVDLEAPAEPEPLPVPVEGRLRGWGPWGYALQTSNRSITTTFLDPSLQVRLADLPGRFVGPTADGRLLLSGGAASPLAVDPIGWTTAAVPWLAPTDHVWRLAVSDDHSHQLALVGKGGIGAVPFRGEVTRVSGPPRAAVLATTDAMTDLVWTEEGDGVVWVSQSAAADDDGVFTLRALAGDAVDHADIEVPVPDVLPGREWVAALWVG